MANINDIYNRMSSMGAYDPRTDTYEQLRRMEQIDQAKQEQMYYAARGLGNQLGEPPQPAKPVPNPEPNPALLLLGEDA